MAGDELEKVVGGHVREARLGQGLTQAAVAERAHVSLGALKHLESGAGATVRTLVKVLRALGQEDWLDTLGPPTVGFTPLDLLSARERAVRAVRAVRPVRTSRRRVTG